MMDRLRSFFLLSLLSLAYRVHGCLGNIFLQDTWQIEFLKDHSYYRRFILCNSLVGNSQFYAAKLGWLMISSCFGLILNYRKSFQKNIYIKNHNKLVHLLELVHFPHKDSLQFFQIVHHQIRSQTSRSNCDPKMKGKIIQRL